VIQKMESTVPKRKLKILILYKCLGFPLRTTIDEHLYSFLRYSEHRCFYYKLDRSGHRLKSKNNRILPDYLLDIDFDMIIFHYGFMSSRWAGKEFMDETYEQVKELRHSKAVKIAMAQDEYKNSADLCDFINKFGVDVMFTVTPESEWKKIYDEVDFSKTSFYLTLTGFLDKKGVARINKLSKGIEKSIDIGYRARNLPAWLGRHGYMKSQVAGIFDNAAKKYELKTDISIRPEDTFLGLAWYRFLISCKYMIGVEGGATVHDKYGKIWDLGTEFMKNNPNASFEEIEAACFPDLDGKLQLIAISPRHLESCATRTCQVLMESTYNGILKPNVHYIPVKNDFSNLDEVLQMIKDDKLREKITNQAYNDIVLSGRWSYESFVNDVVNKGIKHIDRMYLTRRTRPHVLAYIFNRYFDWWTWRQDYIDYRISYKYFNKWFYIEKAIFIVKKLGLKDVVKFIYLRFKKDPAQ
jgi:hypothetical protein